MFDAAVDQAAGLRRLFRTERSRLIPAGCLVPEAQARVFIGQMAAAAGPEDAHIRVVDRRALHQWLRHTHAGEADVPGEEELLFWVVDRVELAGGVHAQGGVRLLVILSLRRYALMEQYAKI